MAYALDRLQCRNLEVSAKREWLLTNGIGGYAMGTPSGLNTRRYHAHLVAALDPPGQRMVLLAAIEAFVRIGNRSFPLSANQYAGAIYPDGYLSLESFEVGTEAVWTYAVEGKTLRKTLRLVPGENTAIVTFENASQTPLELVLRPLICHKPHHEEFTERTGYPTKIDYEAEAFVVTDRQVPLRLVHVGAQRTPVNGWYYRFEHRREAERGLPPRDDLFCPCELKWVLRPGETAELAASDRAEPGSARVQTLPKTTKLGEQFRRACAPFLVQGKNRTTILAGYPWFEDWGRDTMIALPGICLHTGQIEAAHRILRDHALAMKDGLIPNRFREDGSGTDTNTADATLWFAHAAHKTLEARWDAALAVEMLAAIETAIRHHIEGTHFGIAMDPEDGLLRQGEPGLQLTWMDAKIDGWVVTPRHGKPIEIAALWIQMLRIAHGLAARLGLARPEYARLADLGQASFEAKYWHDGRGHYLDTVDPADASLRPNQVIAMALPLSPCDSAHAARALSVVTRELLTPAGLRTLGPEEPGYRGRFTGPMAERDAAYHQGTVWPWLLGSYITAMVRYGGDQKEAKRLLRATRELLSEGGLGGIAEVYDGDEPRHPGGCPWQAWSIAEILRAWVEDCGGD
jgi:predicted glycogen debranching enzyme